MTWMHATTRSAPAQTDRKGASGGVKGGNEERNKEKQGQNARPFFSFSPSHISSTGRLITRTGTRVYARSTAVFLSAGGNERASAKSGGETEDVRSALNHPTFPCSRGVVGHLLPPFLLSPSPLPLLTPLPLSPPPLLPPLSPFSFKREKKERERRRPFFSSFPPFPSFPFFPLLPLPLSSLSPAP